MRIKPIANAFAAAVDDVDLRRPLDSAAVAAIHAGMDRYAVLVFSDQRVSDDEQIAFTKSLGSSSSTPATMSPSSTSAGWASR